MRQKTAILEESKLPARAEGFSHDGVSFQRAAATSAALCGLFLVVYGGTNYLTGLRHDVGTWVYPWERHIPFVPIMIVPYLSIDLFFVAAPFICSDRQELSILARRIIMAILVAGACFLLMPLHFTFARPEVSGVLGAVFNWFRGMDQPFNQFPSLHITLRTILAATYARHTRGPRRLASNVWFGLIGFSTVLTYQHHIVDIIGGFALAGLCFYSIGEARWREPVTRNPRVGLYYLAGTAILIGAARLTWPWGAILLWPAISMSIVACAYFGAGPAIFRKHRGRLPLATWLLLGPVIVGQKLSMYRYRKRSNPWNAVTENVWIGRSLDARDADRAMREGANAILDLTCELPETPRFAGQENYLGLPVMDLTAPTPEQLLAGVSFIDRHARAGRIVYVHCKAGYSRSAATVAAYLLHAGVATSAEQALAILRGCRPGIIVRPEALVAIASHAKLQTQVSENAMTGA